MSQAPTSNPPATLAPAGAPTARRVFNAPVFLTAAFVAIHFLDKLWPAALWFFMPWKMAGWLPVLVGCGLCAAGLGHFARRRTTIVPGHHSRTLVTTGVFAVTRNPMYLGMAVILVGVCFIAGSATVWLVPPAFVALTDRLVIRFEQDMLERRFGDDYRAYCQRVRRWI